MALTPKQYAVIVAILGITSFVFGILAELKKPQAGEVIAGKGVVICKYPSDPSIIFGYVSTALLTVATIAGFSSLFYPYKGKSVPVAALFDSGWCRSYIFVSLATSVFAGGFLIWPTVQEHLHHTRNVHTNLEFNCPTAKTGIFGGGAFMSLNSSLFWLIINLRAAMELTMKQMSMIVATLGLVSFVFGIIAENKKPASGTIITGKGVVICKYPSDPTVALGYLSFAFLVVTTVAGIYSLFYPYKGKSVPSGALFQNTGFLVFFNIALATTGLAASMLLWPTVTEQNHHIHNIHHNLETQCPTAKTGLLGGGAFLSLDSCLFWLVALMLADNARQDYFEDSDDKVAVSYGADEPLKGSA
ncbi:hypothetical protein BUALT_Bualt10G0085700 [Buddleja alternifolia]|uniref:Uncharacterized protein n=1 Tax=Buddleja alternifolia TaxID=168488 RepID=A0AAV6X3P6_9LAMI|nr:hypothetical protein BUALT_Bualt10G0085700 [Buddleja alternifolia]